MFLNEKNKKLEKIFMSGTRVVLAIFLAIILFAAGIITDEFFIAKLKPAAQSSSNNFINGVFHQDVGKPENVDFSLFWDAWRTLQEKYVGRNNLDPQQMVYGAIKGLYASTGDPYTDFFTPTESKDFETTVSGQFSGIGIEIGIKKGILTVIAPLEGTPAKASGLLAGDSILKINGTSTADMSLDQAVSMIRGPQGTKVTLSILRDDWAKPKDFSIVRNVINVPAAEEKMVGNNNDIAYIALYNFDEKAADQFTKAADKALSSGSDKLILDLRDNPGGFFDSAVEIAGWFIKKDEVAVMENDGSGPYVCANCRANGNEALSKLKTMVLVNGGSASAAEILAGALRDDNGIKLIGEKTFGKGSVQELVSIDNSDASAKITVAHWLTPSGKSINETGLTPDISVPDTRSTSANANTDSELDKAIQILGSE